MTAQDAFSEIAPSPQEIITEILSAEQRVLLFGQPGIGKSTLAAKLGQALAAEGRPCSCIGADPGSPGFGIPGAICRGEWRNEGWRLADVEALCSLDAGRFRLPLVSALRRLAKRFPGGTLLVDAPGVIRGIVGAELLAGMVEAARIDTVLMLLRDVETLPLQPLLSSLPVSVYQIKADPQACRPSKKARSRNRTRLWDSYLQGATEARIALADVTLIGLPPPVDEAAAWRGHQIGLLDGQRTLALGEIIDKEDDHLRVRIPQIDFTIGSALLMRDAQRDRDGLLNKAAPLTPPTLWYTPPPDMLHRGESDGGPRPITTLGVANASLINGVFGDPLLHLRLRHQRRSLLFDLGEAGRLPGRIAHQVSDVFISHAHIDHIGGFLWLLRSRIGHTAPCRVFGPPGLAQNLWGLMCGIHWDRIGENGPRFEITEVHDQLVKRFQIQAGKPDIQTLGELAFNNGILLNEPALQVRTVTLDHGTPVLAFAFEPSMQLNVRKERLESRGLSPGPWLNELKQRLAANQREAVIKLPDGTNETAGTLSDDLILTTPGQKLVYATDLADTPENRVRLTALTQGAHTFFCEAAFTEADLKQAQRTHHLTARACGEIASAAGVDRLVPFHFSRRYENEPGRIYAEVQAACPRAVVPKQETAFVP